ncbi:MAG: phosphoribosyltransferase [Planctomycetota bacterium]
MSHFRDRREAGRKLADALAGYAGEDVVTLALPRGGVPVGYEVARALGAPLDVFVVRKLGVPGHEELAMGAIASGGARVMNDDVLASVRITEEGIERIVERERAELERREQAYRGDRGPANVSGRTAILVDDGLATGASMRAAVQAVRTRDPAKIVVAVPTAPARTVDAFRREVDDVVCLVTPRPFFAVGGSYMDFAQTTDAEVRQLLADAADRFGQPSSDREEE